MDLKKQLRNDLVAAMKAGDSEKRDALRLLSSAIKQSEVDSGQELDNEAILAVINKQVKQRRESIDEYEKAGREDLAAQERVELEYFQAYLPRQLSREEVREVAAGVIDEMGVTDMSGMGPVMGRLMSQLKGKADGRVVNEVVRDLLQQRS